MRRSMCSAQLLTRFYGMQRTLKWVKYRQLYLSKGLESDNAGVYTRVQCQTGERRRMTSGELSSLEQLPEGGRIFRVDNATSSGFSDKLSADIEYCGESFTCGPTKHWKTHPDGMRKLLKADRLVAAGKSLGYVRFIEDFAVYPHVNMWTDTGTGSFTDEKVYVVQTGCKTIERCSLWPRTPATLCSTQPAVPPPPPSLSTGSPLDHHRTLRVALALARARVMGALSLPAGRFPRWPTWEAEITRAAPSSQPAQGNIRHAASCMSVPHITLKSIANNAEIDVIWRTSGRRNWSRCARS